MKKPYMICHMMMSVDGRIDCGMTVKIAGSNEYYEALSALDVPTNLSGRVTAQLELAEPGVFIAKNPTESVGKEGFSKKRSANGYQVVVDTKGTLLWHDDSNGDSPLIVIMSTEVTKEYLAYLDSLHISWIVCGETHIDLHKAVEILYTEFGVERMAVVGGGTINAAFLNAGLLDEVSILLGPGIDGRKGMTATFDGLPLDTDPVNLKLLSVQPYDNGAVWLRYALH